MGVSVYYCINMVTQSTEMSDDRKLNPEKDLKSLCQAIAALKTSDECAQFLEDLCTRSELKAMAERWSVARRVAKGESYRKVSEATGASTTTVTRVAQWLNYGTGGYKLILERINGKKGSL